MLELFQTEWCPASHAVRRAVDRARRRLRHPPGARSSAEARAVLLAATGSETSSPCCASRTAPAIVGEDAHPALSLGEHYVGASRGGCSATEGGEGAPPLSRGGMRMLANCVHAEREHGAAVCRRRRARARASSRPRASACCARSTSGRRCRRSSASTDEPYIILGACNPIDETAVRKRRFVMPAPTTAARVRPKEFHFPLSVEHVGGRRVAVQVAGKPTIEDHAAARVSRHRSHDVES